MSDDQREPNESENDAIPDEIPGESGPLEDQSGPVEDESGPLEGESGPVDNDESSDPVSASEAGCMPAVVAGTLLMLIVAFILCGVTTWILFQKRTEIAARSLQGFIPNIEQSLLEPSDKARVIEQLETLIKQMQDPNYEPAQAAAIMQRIVRLPIPHWGELDAVESYARKNFDEEAKVNAEKQLSRVRHAIETNKATVFDIVDVLEPVAVVDDTPIGRSLKQPLKARDVEEVIKRAELLANRAKVADQLFERADMADILEREIQSAKTVGGY